MSSAAAPVALILGNGPRTGVAIARHFLNNGYKVTTVSRSFKDDINDANRLDIQADVTDPKSVEEVFSKTKAAFGLPQVVIYNAAALTITPPDDPLALSAADVSKDLAINTVGLYIVAKEAVKAFGEISGSVPKTFIYTGNALNQTNMARLVTLGIGKAASSHLIESAAKAYAPKGYSFYYADERLADGKSAGGAIDGPAHAELYLKLAREPKQLPWLYTFVKGAGYKKIDAYPE